MISQSSSAPSLMVKIVVEWAPLWGVLLLGIYGVCSVVYGVLALKDHKQASVELEQEVEEAKKALRKKRILGADEK